MSEESRYFGAVQFCAPLPNRKHTDRFCAGKDFRDGAVVPFE